MSLDSAFLLLFLLNVKHFIADWILQTNQIAKEKGSNVDLLLLHSLHHVVGTILIVAIFTSIPTALIIGGIELFIHSLIDYFKSNKHFLGRFAFPSHAYFILLGFDQFLHQICYIGFVYFITQYLL